MGRSFHTLRLQVEVYLLEMKSTTRDFLARRLVRSGVTAAVSLKVSEKLRLVIS